MSTERSAAPADFHADPTQVAELEARLQAQGVTTCYGVFVDIHGIPKSKATPISAFADFCDGHELYTVGANEGLGLAGPHEDECATLPDLHSPVVFPWDHTQVWFNADLYYRGAPYRNDPRFILKRQLQRAEALGLRFNLGIEPEFYVLKAGTDGVHTPITSSRFKGPNACYDLKLSTESEPFLSRLAAHIHALGWGLYSYDQECGRGQYEFDFGYADALTTCDRFIFLRFMARKVAQSLGADVSFMPKPFANDFRNGAHFNMSLADSQTGINLFDPKLAGAGELARRYGPPMTDLGYHFIAGVLKHAHAIAAVTCPTYNSYQGLVAQGDLADFSWAPVLVAWGDNNRSAMLRVPMNRRCIENRAVDMSCNPYLAAAITLAAGLEGIEHGLTPGEPINNDIYTIPRREFRERGIATLPPTLLHALEAFEADPVVERTFGAEFAGIYAEHKRREWERGFYPVSDEQRAERLFYI